MSCLWIFFQRDILYLTELVEQKVYLFLLWFFFLFYLKFTEGRIKIYSWKDIWLNCSDYDVELYYGYFYCRKRWRFLLNWNFFCSILSWFVWRLVAFNGFKLMMVNLLCLSYEVIENLFRSLASFFNEIPLHFSKQTSFLINS